MKRLIAVALLLLGVPLCAMQAHSQPPRRRGGIPPLRPAAQRRAAVPNQLVVKFRPVGRRNGQAVLQARAALHARAGARLVRSIPQLDIQTVQLPSGAAARLYASDPNVAWTEPNYIRHALVAEPDDPAYNQMDGTLPTEGDPTWYEWDARTVQAVEGWSVWPNHYYTAAGGKGTEGIRIAVIDTGIDIDHPDFINAGGTSTDAEEGGQLEWALNRSFSSGSSTAGAPDEHGHGTHVAGIAAAAANNTTGVTGNGYNATVVSLKVLDANGDGTETDIANAIAYAADNGVLIVNMSIGGYTYSQAEQDAVNYAWGKGTLCIAAAGNDASGTTPNYPAALSRVLAVSATSREEGLATYSNFGDYVGIGAPGGDWDTQTSWFLPVYSTMPTYFVTLNGPDYGAAMNYEYLQGTSMACPQVTGMAALYAGSQGWTQSTPNVVVKLWQALQRGADDIAGSGGGWNPYIGFGRMNVFGTMNLASEPNPRGGTVGCVIGQVKFRDTPLANATVRAVPAGGGTAFTASSRSDGGYRIVNAPAGIYNITASVFGESQTLSALEVTAGCDLPGVDFNVGGATVTPPAAPSNLAAAAVSSTRINLTWQDNSGNEQSFKVERRTGSDAFSPIGPAGENATSLSDTGLDPGTQYFYRIRASNAGGDSAYSNEANATTLIAPPAAPNNLAARALTTTQISLSWTDNSSNEDGFKIESKTGTGAFGQIATVGTSVTTLLVTASGNSSYVFRVRAHNAGGDSGYSNEAGVTTLEAPGSLQAVALSSSVVRLSWQDLSTGETGCKVERKLGGGWAQIAVLAGENLTEFDTTPVLNVAATYRIRACSDTATSSYSNEAAVTALAAPGSLRAVALSGSQIHLTWRDYAVGETGFKVERKIGTAGFVQIAALAGENVTAYDTAPVLNVTVTYRVRAYNAGGDSSYSNDAATNALGPPQNLRAVALSSSVVRLSWRDYAVGETGFKVERKLGGGGYAEIAVTVGENVTTFDTPAVLNVLATYRVRAYKGADHSSYSNEATVTPVAAPGSLRAVVLSSTLVRLTWRDYAVGETGFKVERKIGTGNFTQLAALAGENLTTYDTPPLLNVVVTYRVRAYNTGGDSSYSNDAAVTALGQPSNLAASRVTGTQQIRLAWRSNSSNLESGFKIERKTGTDAFVQIAAVGAGVTSFTTTGSLDVPYVYRVRAYNASGDSSYSNEAAIILQGP
jgi:subtilisin family serine protease